MPAYPKYRVVSELWSWSSGSAQHDTYSIVPGTTQYKHDVQHRKRGTRREEAAAVVHSGGHSFSRWAKRVMSSCVDLFMDSSARARPEFSGLGPCLWPGKAR